MASSSLGLHPQVAVVRKSNLLRSWQRQCLLALATSAFIALCAHVAVPLPFTPVPFTLQPFAVLLAGMLLGPAAGFGALLAYLCEGAAGLPVFTPAGAPSVARLLGPTGGYLLAYPFAAAIAGWLPRAVELRYRFAGYVVSGASAMLLVYACGAAWFSHVLHLPVTAAFAGAVLPFIAPDTVKIFAAAGIASTIRTRMARG